MSSTSEYSELVDYRAAVAEMYARLRKDGTPPEARWRQFRQEREQLFHAHPQSPLSAEQKKAFTGLHYYEYDPAYRFVVPVEADPAQEPLEIELPEEGVMRMQRFGRVRFQLQAQPVSLTLFWIMGYGGGIFLPFRDQTGQQDTYGGGRYLLDTIKGADLGREAGDLVIDFNFAYNPSCAYNPRWVCPLSPRENWLPVPVRAGEQVFPG